MVSEGINYDLIKTVEEITEKEWGRGGDVEG